MSKTKRVSSTSSLTSGSARMWRYERDKLYAEIERLTAERDEAIAHAGVRHGLQVCELRSERDQLRADVDRLTAEIAAAHGVLDVAKVGPCSVIGSRVEMLVQERDRMIAVPEREWTVDSAYVEGWNDALGAIARARSGS